MTSVASDVRTVAPSCQALFRSWFGLTDGQAHILTELYLAAGEYRQAEALACWAGVSPSAVKTHIAVIRSAMDTEAIESDGFTRNPGRGSIRGQGYRLTETGVGECQAILWSAAEQLRKSAHGHRVLIGGPFD